MLSQLHLTNNYAQDRYNFLRQLEAYRADAYVIGGIAHIGVGINLREIGNLNQVLQTFGFDVLKQQLTGAALTAEENYMQQIINIANRNYPSTDAGTQQLRTDLNNILLARASNTIAGYPSTFYRRPTFVFNNEAESKTVFDGIIGSFETRVDNWLGYKMADSKERAVLVSLAYNSVTGSRDLLGQKLKAAIANDNRAEAWFEIRYNSNGGKSRSSGIASRRYSESNMFNLYDSVFNETGAKEIMRMYTIQKAISNQLSA